MKDKYIFNSLGRGMPQGRLFRAYKLFFNTLTSNDRLMIINSLRKHPKTVNELQRELRLEQTRVSHNLRRLRHCHFVEVNKKGKYRIYKLDTNNIIPLMNIIDRHMKEYCTKIISHYGSGK